jgi:hypothetical protein
MRRKGPRFAGASRSFSRNPLEDQLDIAAIDAVAFHQKTDQGIRNQLGE